LQLSDQERARFFFVCFSFFRMFEDIHFQFQHGALDPELWEGYKTHYGAYGKAPGLHSYWGARRQIFRPAFREFFDSYVPPEVQRIDEMVLAGEGDSPR
jgi:hypothetical protein